MAAKKKFTRKDWTRLVNSFRYQKTRPSPKSKYWDEKIETMSRDELRHIQETKLKALVHYLNDNSPWYKRHFAKAGFEPGDLKGLQDLAKLPLTTKEDWSENQLAKPPFGDFHCVTPKQWAKDGWMLYSTGGTTAKPRFFNFTLHDRDIWAYTWARAYWAYGLRPGTVFFNTSVYGPFPGMWGSQYGAHLMRCPIIPGGGMDSRRRLFFIQETNVTCVVGVPSYVLHLGQVAKKEYGIDLAKDTKVTDLVTMAEPGPCIPSSKQRLEDAWGGARLHDLFGHTECFPTATGWSCAEENAVRGRPMRDHLSEDMGIFEVLDPETYEPLPPGQRGVLVVTNLWSEGIPALRYLMGDYMVYSTEPCACGRTLAQADGGLQGRADHTLRIRGVWIIPGAVEEVVHGFNELDDEFQIVADKVGDREFVTVRIEPKPEIDKSAWPDIQKRVAAECRFVLGLGVEIDLCETGTLPRFERGDLDAKAVRVKDLREAPGS